MTKPTVTQRQFIALLQAIYSSPNTVYFLTSADLADAIDCGKSLTKVVNISATDWLAAMEAFIQIRNGSLVRGKLLKFADKLKATKKG